MQLHEYETRQKSNPDHPKSIQSVLNATQFASKGRHRSTGLKDGSEVANYLSEANLPATEEILDVWRGLEHIYPAMAQMAKDILSIPVAGVGVERLFSMARDVVTYRRNRFRGRTIERIMIIKRTAWFSGSQPGPLLPVPENIVEQAMMEDELADSEPTPTTEWIDEDPVSDVDPNASSQESIYSSDPDSESAFETMKPNKTIASSSRSVGTLQVVISPPRQQQNFSLTSTSVNGRKVSKTYTARRQTQTQPSSLSDQASINISSTDALRPSSASPSPQVLSELAESSQHAAHDSRRPSRRGYEIDLPVNRAPSGQGSLRRSGSAKRPRTYT